MSDYNELLESAFRPVWFAFKIIIGGALLAGVLYGAMHYTADILLAVLR